MKTDSVKEELEKEGFKHIYDWIDPPNETYDEHSHKDKVKLVIVSGSITFNLDGVERELKDGDKLLIPPNTKHSAVVGPKGCIYVVGEMIEGDS